MSQRIDPYDFIINALREIEEGIDEKIEQFENILKELEKKTNNDIQITLTLAYLFRDITQMEAQ